ncbi:hypothetical protein [Sphingomonas sp. AX6]|uniref:hypothetical protein n=1 Tax=Sphingomonas sp. AX6 TaxID=2653171 RepID=UPI0012EFAFA7|nr:hypothetical protein [Sphingomonas sp. AX6]VXC47645.1 conserved membrane hypothetical protein [Sphingomonas sp. AX6]
MTMRAALAVNPRTEARDALAKIAGFFLFVSLAMAAVVPHSFQEVEAATFVATTLICLVLVRRDDWLDRVILAFFAATAVTAAYIWVGYTNGAPRAASNQTLFVYIIAPFMWIIMSTTLMQYVGLERTTKWLIWFTWAAVASVAAFFFLFLTFGEGAVSFLVSEANVNVSDGYAGATMLVYGSLIFLSGALYAQPMIVRSPIARIVLPGLVFLAALTSGRSALMIAIPIGFLTGAVLRRRSKLSGEGDSARSVLLPTILLGVVSLIIMVAIDYLLVSVDLVVLIERLWEELTSAGGSERTEQAAALWEGFLDSYGMGVGHGVGVPYIRNMLFPWRYEVMPLATLLRVGLFGFIAYAAVYFMYGQQFLKRWRARDLRGEDIYMIGGLVPSLLATATNPYIESFVFQWMYFLPVMAIAVRPVTGNADTAANA